MGAAAVTRTILNLGSRQSNSFWPCPNCGREMLHFARSPRAGGKAQGEICLCVVCNSEFRSLDRGGQLAFVAVTHSTSSQLSTK